MNAEYIETIAGKTPVEVSHVFKVDGRRFWVPGYLSLDDAEALVSAAPEDRFWEPASVQVQVFRGSRFGMWIGLPINGIPQWHVMVLVLNRYGIAIDHQYASEYGYASSWATREDAMRTAIRFATRFDVPATLVTLDDGPTDGEVIQAMAERAYMAQVVETGMRSHVIGKGKEFASKEDWIEGYIALMREGGVW